MVVKLLNALLFAAYMVGHAAAAVFLNNTRVIGLPETRYKLAVLAGQLAGWPALGLALASTPQRLASSLVPPFALRSLWAWTFTMLGLRYIAQETHRKLHPHPLPNEILTTSIQDRDMRNYITEVEGLDKSGLRGVLNKTNQLYALEVVTYEVRLKTLPKELDGFTILQISDIHYAPSVSQEFVKRIASIALDTSPDLIALTGDYQTYPQVVEDIGDMLSPIGKWSQEQRNGLGAIAVLGNHDREAGAARVTNALRRAGIKVLHNNHVRIEKNGASLYVVGVADPWSYKADLDLALHGVPQGSCTILLAHVPDFLITAAQREISLQLSGHNHGGQIKLPVLGPVLVSSRYGRRYAEGFHKLGDTLMYASRGLGGKPPIRFGCKPEITRLILRTDERL